MEKNQMKKNENYYAILGIHAIGEIQKEEITDNLIEQKYQRLKQILEKQLERLRNIPGKELGIKHTQESLMLIEKAYNMLNTKEKREKYEEYYKKEYENILKLRELIEKEGGNADKRLERKTKNFSNRAAEVKKNPQYLEYTTEYEDSDTRIVGLEEINFLNGNLYKDSLKSYTIFFKEGEKESPSGYEFYSKIVEIKMSDPEYRNAVYKSIREGIKANRKYIGVIEKDKNNTYYIAEDDGQKYAVKEREIQKENERRGNIGQEERN